MSDGLGSIYFETNFSDMNKRMRLFFNGSKPELIREASRETAKELGMKLAERVKHILDAEHSVSGRLAASFGYYDPSFLKDSSDSSPHDAYFHEETRGSQFYVELGSWVPYAAAVFQGFSVTDTRVVYLPAEDRFITVHPFTFNGIHAVERAMTEVANDAQYEAIFKKAMANFTKVWNNG